MRLPSPVAEASWEGAPAEAWARRLGLPAVEVHTSLPSTNQRSREWVREGAPPFSLVLAEEQTAGRGRGGRGWHSPRGAGVWASLLVPSRGADVDALLPLRLGLALAPRLEVLAGTPVGVKWPNDLFLGEAGIQGKVGGILCERVARPAPGGREAAWIVVGVGINVVPVEVQAEYPPAALSDGTARVDRGAVLGALVEGVRAAASIPGKLLSPREREGWEARDILAGRAVQVMGQEAGRERGIARGVDPGGRLRVETRYGEVGVVAGSVRPLEPLTGGVPFRD